MKNLILMVIALSFSAIVFFFFKQGELNALYEEELIKVTECYLRDFKPMHVMDKNRLKYVLKFSVSDFIRTVTPEQAGGAAVIIAVEPSNIWKAKTSDDFPSKYCPNCYETEKVVDNVLLALEVFRGSPVGEGLTRYLSIGKYRDNYVIHYFAINSNVVIEKRMAKSWNISIYAPDNLTRFDTTCFDSDTFKEKLAQKGLL